MINRYHEYNKINIEVNNTIKESRNLTKNIKLKPLTSDQIQVIEKQLAQIIPLKEKLSSQAKDVTELYKKPIKEMGTKRFVTLFKVINKINFISSPLVKAKRELERLKKFENTMTEKLQKLKEPTHSSIIEPELDSSEEK